MNFRAPDGTVVIHRIDARQLFAAALFDGVRISKSSRVSFLSSEHAFRIRQISEIHTGLTERRMDREHAETSESKWETVP